MPDHPDKIQWHPAFYAAVELELGENIDQLTFEKEHELSKKPIQIDLLIIKKSPEQKLENEIAHNMKTYNIIEYKSPDDGLSIDDFFKAIGYACLYKGYGETVDQIPSDEITVSLFRERYPRELFLTLEEYGYTIEKRTNGIYGVSGRLPFPVQVIVIRQLSPEDHSSLRILSKRAKKEDIKIFLKKSEKLKTQGEKESVKAVLRASTDANLKIYEEIRRETNMYDALRELMKEDFDASLAEGLEKGLAEGFTEGEQTKLIKQIQKKMKKGQPPAVIAEELLEEESHVQTIYDTISETGLNSDPREIYRKLNLSSSFE